MLLISPFRLSSLASLLLHIGSLKAKVKTFYKILTFKAIDQLLKKVRRPPWINCERLSADSGGGEVTKHT